MKQETQSSIMHRKGYVTVVEAARLAHVPSATIYGWVKAGSLTCERVGPRRIYVPRGALIALVGPVIGNAA